jgi:exosome complex component RRP45
MRPPSPSIPEKDFFHAALAQGLRLDGRSPLAARRLEIAFGEELGAVEVALGKTRCVRRPAR